MQTNVNISIWRSKDKEAKRQLAMNIVNERTGEDFQDYTTMKQTIKRIIRRINHATN
jgi:hypothetical protein